MHHVNEGTHKYRSTNERVCVCVCECECVCVWGFCGLLSFAGKLDVTTSHTHIYTDKHKKDPAAPLLTLTQR